MFKSKKILAFIGARAGSKGLKDKNIIDFAGKPLIAWTIRAARGSKYIDRTLVSTDGERIAAVAKEAGADVPFLRPTAIAQDHSLIEEALDHALRWLKKNEKKSYDYIVLLQPTSPLRTTEEIDRALEHYFKMKKSAGDTLVSVTVAPAKLGWLMQKNKQGYIHFCLEKNRKKAQRQDVPEYYLPNGAIYIAATKNVIRAGFYGKQTMPFVMSEETSFDIDSRQDLEKALEIFKKTNSARSEVERVQRN